MENRNEQDLVRKILDGEIQAFSLLLQQYRRPVFSLVRSIVNNREDAEELTQDVFVKAYRSLSSFAGRSSLSTWLYRIAYNAAISATRKHKPVFPDFDERLLSNLPDESVDELLDKENDEAMLVRLEQTIGKLNPEEKALITLYYTENKSVAELAHILDLKQDNVKVKLHRTRKKIVLMMEADKL